ncbi:MAG: rhodanese-like domain-containing protein [Anaerolineae bacterium]
MRTLLKIVGVSLLACVMLALAACGGSTSAPTASGSQSSAAPAAPANPAPDFNAVAKGTDKLFVPVETVKQAVDNKSDVVIIDARAPSDFAAGHIPGAINIPYYDMPKRYSEVPKDKWVITYCACPHAEAEQAARELMKQGYTKVKAIDEGYFGWVDKGYPTTKS